VATRQRGGGHGGAAEGEFRAGPAAGSALLDGATFRSKAVVYADIGGLAVVEGDIVLGTVAEVAAATSAAGGPGVESIGITGSQFRWPGAVVPFEIDAGLPNQQRVTDAIAHWEATTRIRFRARTASDVAVVRFVAGGGCSSTVGMRGNSQDVTLGAGCTTGNAIHEIGHTVGLWHEQSREDRDQFVEIVFANIAADMQHNFLQHISDGDDIGAYDFGSIMHYPGTAFSTNGQATIVPKVPLPAGVVMGQRDALSAGDIAGVHQLYPGPVVTIKEPVRDTVKEAAKDPLRDTVKESFRDSIKEPVADVTIKEAVADVGPVGPGRTPFVLAGDAGDAPDSDAGLSVLVQQLSQALSAVEQQRAAILDQLGQAVEALRASQA
jgi:Astacin (Peptidase family M12A)